MERRRKRKSCLEAFWTVCFVVITTVLLNGMASLFLRQAFDGLPSPWWEAGVTWQEVVAGVLDFSVVIAAVFWDRLLFVGVCRQAILPKIEVSVSPTRVVPGDVVEVTFSVKGATDWFRRIEAQLDCTEIDDDCQMKDIYRETVFSSSEQKDFAKGSFSVTIPIGFPISGVNEKKKTAVMWGVSFRGRTAPGFMPDVLGFEEIEVVEGAA